MRHITGRALRPDETAALLARLEAHWDQHGFGLWAAEERSTGELVGWVGLSHPTHVPEMAEEVEVGWRLRRPAWGRGLATEGGRASLAHAHEVLGLRRLVSLVHPDNARSRRVAEKLGLEVEREIRHPHSGWPVLVYAREG